MREQRRQEDMGQKVMGLYPGSGKGIFLEKSSVNKQLTLQLLMFALCNCLTIARIPQLPRKDKKQMQMWHDCFTLDGVMDRVVA